MSQLSLANMPAAILPPDGASDHWFTPCRYFLPWHYEFHFTLDVAATAESRKVARYFDLAANGLAQSWAGERCWMNPPYSDIAPWAEKALNESQGAGALVVGLLPVWTDRAWWHEFIEPYRLTRSVEVRFIRGRIRFGFPGNPEGLGHHGGGTFPNCLVIWRPQNV